jgi:hypothetical protein
MKRRIIACCLAASMVLGLAGCMEEEGYEGYEADYSEEQYESSEETEDEEFYSESETTYSDSEYGYPYDNHLGTAKELEGKIAVVSIFVNDATTGWNFESEADQQLDALIYKDLEVATDYLENVSKSYGKDVEFIYDWKQYPELAVDLDITDIDYREVDSNYNQFYNAGSNSIDQNVQTAKILSDVGADQVIYMMYFNTPETNTITSTTFFCHDSEFTYEICFMFMNCEGYLECPSHFAHEMLHTFGVPDLYTAADYGITQEYVDYAANSGLNDIMRINDDPETGLYVYDSIPNEVTDITAYYAGLTDYSETVNEWGFAPSQH